MSRVNIPKRDITLAGLLFPAKPTADGGGGGGESAAKTHPAVVVVHPGGGVKEQTASLYSKHFAELGYVALTYDASYQGESGGTPHFLEDPDARTTDVSAAVDFLQGSAEAKAAGADPERVFVFGICAGGGYSVCAAKTDHRIKALATASMVNIGDGMRRGWYGKDNPAAQATTLDAITPVLTSDAQAGGAPQYAPYVPDSKPAPGDGTPEDLIEAHDYYRTPRAQHERSANKMLVASTPLIARFDAFHLAEEFLTQPSLFIAGTKAGSAWHSQELAKRLEGKQPAKLLMLDGFTHMDLYDKPGAVKQALDAAHAHFQAVKA